MKQAEFTISKKALQDKLSIVSKSVAKKSSSWILGCVKIEVVQDDNKIILTANDTEVQIKTSAEIQSASEDISFCADHSFINAIKAIPEQPLRIIVSKSDKPTGDGLYSITISIVHNSGTVKIPGFDHSGFEELKSLGGSSFEIPVFNLVRGINKTIDFTEINTLQPYFGGVFMDTGKTLSFVGSNGNNLCKFEDQSISAEVPPFIIPLKCASIIQSTFSDGDSNKAEIIVGDKNTYFNNGSIEIVSVNIAFKFPAYGHIFPAEHKVRSVVNKDAFHASLNRALSISEESSYMSMYIGDQMELVLKNTYSEKTMTEKIQCSSDGEIKIGIPTQPCKKIMGVIDGDFSFFFLEPQNPILIRPEKNEDNTEMTILVMPMNITE